MAVPNSIAAPAAPISMRGRMGPPMTPKMARTAAVTAIAARVRTTTLKTFPQELLRQHSLLLSDVSVASVTVCCCWFVSIRRGELELVATEVLSMKISYLKTVFTFFAHDYTTFHKNPKSLKNI